MTHIETERKFLIKMPSSEVLSCCDVSEITQIYAEPEGGCTTDRIRRRIHGNKTVYTRTRKTRLTDISSTEEEYEISAGEFELRSKKIKAGTNPIKKSRYIIPYRDNNFEIDIYPFWDDRAIMEIELEHEDDGFELPPGITVIREVTGLAGYSNYALSVSVPHDDIKTL